MAGGPNKEEHLVPQKLKVAGYCQLDTTEFLNIQDSISLCWLFMLLFLDQTLVDTQHLYSQQEEGFDQSWSGTIGPRLNIYLSTIAIGRMTNILLGAYRSPNTLRNLQKRPHQL